MVGSIRTSAQKIVPVVLGTFLLVLGVLARDAGAINALPTPEPQPGSYGIEATKRQPPPTKGATITTPGNGASFSQSPITVTGICPKGLLVQVYNNGVMVGSVMCNNGSFSIQVSLFAGTNELSALVYDDLGQAGPVSNTMTVTYTDTRFSAFGQGITLTSSYGRRSAAANAELQWPLQLTGGTGPYAFSIDWGDSSSVQLKSQSIAGLATIAHVYKKAGIYHLNVRVADARGVSAYLQLVAVANGKIDATANAKEDSKAEVAKPTILWVPLALSLGLLIPTYWLGRRSQLVTLHKKMLKERDAYDKSQRDS